MFHPPHLRPTAALVSLLACAPVHAQEPGAEARHRVDAVVDEWRRGSLVDRDVTRGLVALGDAVAPALGDVLASGGKVPVIPIVKALSRFQTEAAAAVLGRVLESKDLAERVAAVDALGAMRHRHAYPHLVRAVEDPSRPVASAAGSALVSKWNDENEVVRAILERLESTADKKKLGRLLGRVGGETARTALMDLVARKDAASRVAGLQGLWHAGRIGDGDRLLDLLANASAVEVREQTCIILGRIRCHQAVRKLIDLLGDDDSLVRGGAHWALQQITGRAMGEDREPWERWWEREGKAEPVARRKAEAALDAFRRRELTEPELTEVLVGIGTHATPCLCEHLDARRPGTPLAPIAAALGQKGNAAAAASLGRLLASEVKDHRLSAVVALGGLEHPQAYPYVVGALDDVDPSVAAKAESVLLAPEHPTERIVAAIEARVREAKDRSRLARILARRGGDDALRVLRDLAQAIEVRTQVAGLQGLWIAGREVDGELVREVLLESDSAAVKKQACLVLGKLSCWTAVRDLIGLLGQREDRGLTSSAHWALKRISGKKLRPDPELWELWWRLEGEKRARGMQGTAKDPK